MKKVLFSALTLGILAFAACKKEDNKGGNGGDHFKDVPSGEIVDVALRHKALTGEEEETGSKGTNGSLKWWKVTDGKDFAQCDGDVMEEEFWKDREDVYWAFANDGTLYQKQPGTDGGTEVTSSKWKWKDANKNEITVVDYADLVIRALNNKTLVIAAYEEMQDEEEICTSLNWRAFDYSDDNTGDDDTENEDEE